jgi:putative DNA primase/helicase
MVRRGENTSDLAKLKGARLVTAAEAEDGHRLAESQIKLVTGGENIQCRFLYGEWFEYQPEFKIVLLTNHKPLIRGDDHAIWRRIRLVPFNVTIAEDKRDPDLPEKLRMELPGVLAWIVSGAKMWLQDGLGQPEEIREATADYRTEQNVIGIFLESCCSTIPEASAEAGLLFQSFDRWRNNEGHRKVTQTKFGKMLTQLGYQKDRSSATGRTVYQGIGIS